MARNRTKKNHDLPKPAVHRDRVRTTPNFLNLPGRRREILIAAGLVLANLAVFGQVIHLGFINLDDPMYVTENPYIRNGFTKGAVAWAFTTFYFANWHPATWLSLMLDYKLNGLNAGGYHVTNLVLHILNTIGLFLVLRRMTESAWKSATVALLFAVHPLHVESVAWISERKGLLSTSFGILAVWFYASYSQRPTSRRYLAVCVAFLLSLMAKPMLVTLPFLFLLLDYWPLNRVGRQQSDEIKHAASSWWPLLQEKILLLVLAGASGLVTVLAQGSSGAVQSFSAVPLAYRIANALASYVRYLRKTIWPSDLAVYYPFNSYNLPTYWEAVGAGALLLAISWAVLRSRRKHPFLMVGWFWYLGTLVPVIGLMQVGGQAMADRYSYVPLIGLFILSVWGVTEVIRKPSWQLSLKIMTVVAVTVLGVQSVRQLGYWQNNITLFQHALAVTSHNSMAQHSLGKALGEQGKLDEAVAHSAEAVRINPGDVEARQSLAAFSERAGKIDQSIAQYSEILRYQPDRANTHFGLGAALLKADRIEEAVFHTSEALRLNPEFADAHDNLAILLVKQGKADRANFHFSESTRLRPDNFSFHNNFGIFLYQQGKYLEASHQFSEAVRLNPAFADAQNNLNVTRKLLQDQRQ